MLFECIRTLVVCSMLPYTQQYFVSKTIHCQWNHSQWPFHVYFLLPHVECFDHRWEGAWRFPWLNYLIKGMRNFSVFGKVLCEFQISQKWATVTQFLHKGNSFSDNPNLRHTCYTGFIHKIFPVACIRLTRPFGSIISHKYKIYFRLSYIGNLIDNINESNRTSFSEAFVHTPCQIPCY